MNEVAVQEPPILPPTKRRRRRLLILLFALLVCVGVAFVQRDHLARVPNTLARRALVSHDEERAFDWLQWSQRISSRNPETHFLLARYYRRQGRLDDARENLKRAHEFGWPTVLLQREQWLGMAQAGQLREVESYLPLLLADAGDDGAEISEAFVIGYLRARQFSQADMLLNAWIQDHPLDPQPHVWKAIIERENDRPDAAERALRWALDLKPDDPRAALLLADVLAQDKRKDEEAIFYYRIAQRDPKQRVAASTAIARSLRALGRRAVADQELQEALQLAPDSKELILELANQLIEQGEYAAALERLKPLEALYPTDRDVRYALGIAYRGTGHQADAQAHLEFATYASKELNRVSLLVHQANQSPDDAAIRYEIGSLLLKYGSTKEGIVWLESVLQLDPNHRATHELLADYYQRRAKEGPDFERLAAEHRARSQSGS